MTAPFLFVYLNKIAIVLTFYESLPRDLRDLEPSHKPFINSLRDHLFSYSSISHAY